MQKVFSAPKCIELPVFNFNDLKKTREDEEAYINQVIEFAKKNSKDKYAGVFLKIPHADGYACYIVFQSKSVRLIHLEIGDCWDAPLAHRLLTKDIIQMVAQEKAMKKLFPPRTF